MGKSVDDAGGAVVEILAENSIGGTAAKSDLDAWITAYSLTVTSMRDADGSASASHNALGIRESAFIVDLSTMKIVQMVPGDTTGLGTTSIAKAVPMILALLGQKGG
jgi:hypothetical protein